MNIKIESIHFDADQKLLDFISKKFGKLEQYYDRIMKIDVTLKLENSGQVRDKVVEVKVDVPGELIVCKGINKSFEAAVDEVVDVAKRQLIRHKQKARSF